MQRGTNVMDRPLFVPLKSEEREARVQTLLSKLGDVDALREKKAGKMNEAKRVQKEIDEALEEVARLRRVLVDDGQQLTLADAFAADMPNQAQARQALSEVARAAGVAIDENTEPVKITEAPTVCPACQAEPKELMKGLWVCKNNPGCVWVGMIETPAHDSTVDAAIDPATAGPAIDAELARRAEEGGDDVDDPRPRCSGCKDVLAAADIERGVGLCEQCEIDGEPAEPGEEPAQA